MQGSLIKFPILFHCLLDGGQFSLSQRAGFGEAPQQAFLRACGPAKISGVATPELLAVCALPYTWREKKRRSRFSLRSLRLSGFSDTLCGSLYDDKLLIHDGARGEVYKLGQVLLRPAFSFSSALDFLAQGMTVQALFVLVHFHITPILFYISGRNMRTK